MIKIDSRECEKVFNLAEKFGTGWIKDTLPVGDFVFEEKGIVVERKTIVDFVMSIRNGHLQKQLQQMEQFPYSFLIISGTLRDLVFNPMIHGWTVEHHLGSLASISARFKTKVLIVDNDTQLIKLVFKLFEKIDDGKTFDIRNTELLKTKVDSDILFLRLLCCFDGIGLKRAEKLLIYRPEIKGACQLLEDLMNEKKE